jgi:hypothetical protein
VPSPSLPQNPPPHHSSTPLPPRARRTAFNEYQLCVERRGKEDIQCLQRGRDYSTVCPEKWVEDWKGDLERGVSMSVGTAFIKGE